MAFRPLVITSVDDLRVVTMQPGQEVVQSRRADETFSTFGCGWNVLLVLGIVTREEAQAGVDEIVASHRLSGTMDSHPGLRIGESTMIKNSISGIISKRRGIPLGINRFHFDEFGRDPKTIKKEIIDRFSPKNITFKPGEKYCYVIIKYIRNWETGLGHTVLLAFEKKEAEEHEWEVTILDPQTKEINVPFEGALDSVLNKKSPFVGIACCGIPPSGGKSRKRK